MVPVVQGLDVGGREQHRPGAARETHGRGDAPDKDVAGERRAVDADSLADLRGCEEVSGVVGHIPDIGESLSRCQDLMLTTPLSCGNSSCMTDTAPSTPLAWDLVDRLNKAMRVGNCKPGEMRSILGVSPATMTNYLNGTTRPKDGMLRQVAIRCAVPFEWLQTGVMPIDGGPDQGKTSSAWKNVIALPLRRPVAVHERRAS